MHETRQTIYARDERETIKNNRHCRPAAPLLFRGKLRGREGEVTDFCIEYQMRVVVCCGCVLAQARALGGHTQALELQRPREYSRTHYGALIVEATLTTHALLGLSTQASPSLVTQERGKDSGATQPPSKDADAPPSARLLLLLDLVDLGRLPLHLTGTGQRSVNLPHV